MPKSTCLRPDCAEPVRARDLCRRHYGEAHRRGLIPPSKAPRTCRWPDCNDDAKCRGLCIRDYWRAKGVGTWDEPWLVWRLPIECEWCGVEFTPFRSDGMFCSSACSVASFNDRNPGHAAMRSKKRQERHPDRHRMKEQRRRAQKARTQVEYFTETEIRATHGDDCHLCSLPIDYDLRWPDPMSPSIDHVIPLSRGGGHTLRNCQMSHLRCNVAKGNRVAPETPTPA